MSYYLDFVSTVLANVVRGRSDWCPGLDFDDHWVSKRKKENTLPLNTPQMFLFTITKMTTFPSPTMLRSHKLFGLKRWTVKFIVNYN